MKKTLKFLIWVSAIFIFSSLSITYAAAQELDVSQGSIVITSTGYSVGGETETETDLRILTARRLQTGKE